MKNYFEKEPQAGADLSDVSRVAGGLNLRAYFLGKSIVATTGRWSEGHQGLPLTSNVT